MLKGLGLGGTREFSSASREISSEACSCDTPPHQNAQKHSTMVTRVSSPDDRGQSPQPPQTAVGAKRSSKRFRPLICHACSPQ